MSVRGGGSYKKSTRVESGKNSRPISAFVDYYCERPLGKIIFFMQPRTGQASVDAHYSVIAKTETNKKIWSSRVATAQNYLTIVKRHTLCWYWNQQLHYSFHYGFFLAQLYTINATTCFRAFVQTILFMFCVLYLSFYCFSHNYFKLE